MFIHNSSKLLMRVCYILSIWRDIGDMYALHYKSGMRDFYGHFDLDFISAVTAACHYLSSL